MSQQDPRSDYGRGRASPGQGQYNQYPESGYDDRFEAGPRPTTERGYVPYQDSYESFDRAAPPRSQYPPKDQYAYGNNAAGSQYSDRPYAPSEPRPHSFNQMAPYDENKTEAEWREGAYTHDRPPPSEYKCRSYHDERYDDRYDDRYEEDSDYDCRRRRRSRRYSGDDLRQKALEYPTDPKKGGRDFLGGSEGDRENGLGPSLLGGAGGAFLGHRFAKGSMGTVAGGVLGAIAAGAVGRQYEKRKSEKTKAQREDPIAAAAGPYTRQGRDMHDGRESAREEERGGFRNRLRSMSRGATARIRSMSRPRKRSPSVESDERYHYR